jgi:prepilin-type N-terminal cleavage/methylation domain-containing protein
MKLKRKGFTIVELVIVIAVIAILAAILIPTLSDVISEAKLSAQQQALSDMNLQLSMQAIEDDVDHYNSADEVKGILYEAGYSAKDLKAAFDEYAFFYDRVTNKMSVEEINDVCVYDAESFAQAITGFPAAV